MKHSTSGDQEQAREPGSDPRRRLQVGGSLFSDALYVRRDIDPQLIELLAAGRFCHVVGPRQIGKSSLRNRTADRLEAQGARCVLIDLTSFGRSVTIEQWYFGLMDLLAENLELSDPGPHWSAHQELPPAQRWLRYLEAVVDQIQAPLVVFLDEIDVVRDMPFGQEFLATLRAAFEARNQSPRLERVAFCLLGVFAPWDLCQDPSITPLNVAHELRMGDFSRVEFDAFKSGISRLPGEGVAWLDAVYHWTDGHPYMSQKLLVHLTSCPPDAGVAAPDAVEAAVGVLFFQNPFDDPNLTAARVRFDRKDGRSSRAERLSLYREMLLEERISLNTGEHVQTELLLSGMARVRLSEGGPYLAVRNRIFAQVFDRRWVRAQSLHRWLNDEVEVWLESGRDPDRVPTGIRFDEAIAWARQRKDLTPEVEEFLRAGLEARLKAQERSAQLRYEKEHRRMWQTIAAVGTVGALLLISGLSWSIYRIKQEQGRW